MDINIFVFCYHCCRFTNSQAKTSSEKRCNAGKTNY